MSDGVDILCSSFTPDDRTEAQCYLRAVLLGATDGQWRDLLTALDEALIDGRRRYDAGLRRKLDYMLFKAGLADPEQPPPYQVLGTSWAECDPVADATTGEPDA